MYIVIVGGGRVGYYLTRELLNEGHEILVVEKNPVVAERFNEDLGSICYRGDGCEAITMAEVGTGRADMLVAVTGDDEDNLIACEVAKFKFNVPRTIARLRNPQRRELFEKLGVDVTVSSTQIILEAIEQQVPTHPLTHLLNLTDKGMEIVTVKVSGETGIGDTRVRDLKLPADCKLALVIPAQGPPCVPTPQLVLHAGDQVVALTSPQSEEELRLVLSGAVGKPKS